MSTPNLAARFQHQPPRDENDVRAHQRVRGAVSQTAHVIDAVAPDGREKATALTKLEEAMMWANAAIARGGTADAPKPRPGDGGPLTGTEKVLTGIDDAVKEAIKPLNLATRHQLADELGSVKDRLEELQREQLDEAKAHLAPYENGAATRLARELEENNGLAVITTGGAAA